VVPAVIRKRLFQMIDFVADANAGKQPQPAVHPRGSRARVLLSSVFGPYGCDDEYGSRAINPMELYTIKSPEFKALSRCACFTAVGG